MMRAAKQPPSTTGTVSKTAAVLDADLQAYETKALTDDAVFLFLGGISQKVRELGVEGNLLPHSTIQRSAAR